MAPQSFLFYSALFALSVLAVFVNSTPTPAPASDQEFDSESQSAFETFGWGQPVTQAPTTTTLAPTTTIKPALPAETAFTVGILNVVNKDRASRGVPALVVNRTLVAVAQKCAADYLTAAKVDGGCKWNVTGVELTGTDPLLGEYGSQLVQLATKNDTKLGVNMANTWKVESNQVDFESLLYSEATLHFTQSVWKGSVSVGCAYKNDDGKTDLYASCIFYPPGNVEFVLTKGADTMTNPTNLRENVFNTK